MKKGFFLALLFLAVSGLYGQSAPEGLFIGSKAPDFTGTDQQGQSLRLKDLLKKGKVVLLFYRGFWCPYCNKQLARFQDSLSFILEKGAVLIAVSPEKPDNILKTTEKTGASFSILHDKDRKIMNAYQVSFEVPEQTIARYKNTGIDLEKLNGENGTFLPVPAMYIIDGESTVRFRFFENDYKKRPSVREILDNL